MIIKKLVAIGISAFLIFAFTACESEGPAEKAGKKIDETAETASEKTKEAADTIKKKADEMMKDGEKTSQ